MDDIAVNAAELQRALGFIRRINSLLGYTRSIIHHLSRFSRDWQPNQRIDIIDLATGSADIHLAILRWAEKHGHNIHITAIDRHPVTIRAAATTAHCPLPTAHSHLHIVQADVFELPFADQSFDYAMTAMFLHHLDEEGIVRVLRSMDYLARRGVIVADLLRHRRAYAWISLFTLLTSDMIRHDARTSVAQALTRPEILSRRDRANLSYATYHRHFGHRFILAGEKPSASHVSSTAPP